MKIVELLGNNMSEASNIMAVYDELEREFNRFGNFGKVWENIWAELSDSGKENSWKVICIAAIGMVQYRKDYCDGKDTHDLRFEATEKFAVNHIDEFKRKLLSLGSVPEYMSEDLKITNRSVMHSWMNIHSTLKQAIFGGFVNGIILKGDETFVLQDDIYFPFI